MPSAAEAQPAVPEGEEGSEPYRGSVEPKIDEDKRYQELLVKFRAQCEAERQKCSRPAA